MHALPWRDVTNFNMAHCPPVRLPSSLPRLDVGGQGKKSSRFLLSLGLSMGALASEGEFHSR